MGAALKILFCDDDPGLRDLVCDYFKEEGIDVSTADDGQAGLKLMKEDKFDGIITDVEMPNLSGLDFICEIKGDKQNARTPIFILTGMADENVRRIAHLHVVEVFEKPFEPVSILKRMKEKVFSGGEIPRYDKAILDCFHDTVEEILGHHVKEKITYGTVEVKSTNDTDAYVSSMVGLLGVHFRGSVSIVASEGFCSRMVEDILGESDPSDETRCSTISEITNHVAGKLKTKFEAHGLTLQITVPSTFMGKGKIMALTNNYTICLPLLVGGKEAEIRLNLSDIDKSLIKTPECEEDDSGIVMLW